MSNPNWSEFITKLLVLRQECFDLGLLKSYQKFDELIKEVGYERGEQVEKIIQEFKQ